MTTLFPEDSMFDILVEFEKNSQILKSSRSLEAIRDVIQGKWPSFDQDADHLLKYYNKRFDAWVDLEGDADVQALPDCTRIRVVMLPPKERTQERPPQIPHAAQDELLRDVDPLANNSDEDLDEALERARPMVLPRNNKGAFPILYTLPAFPKEEVRDQIDAYGNCISSSTRRLIARILAEDVAKYACGPWPNQSIRNTVVKRLLEGFPKLADVDVALPHLNESPMQTCTWTHELALAFISLRRRLQRKENPAFQALRHKVQPRGNRYVKKDGRGGWVRKDNSRDLTDPTIEGAGPSPKKVCRSMRRWKETVSHVATMGEALYEGDDVGDAHAALLTASRTEGVQMDRELVIHLLNLTAEKRRDELWANVDLDHNIIQWPALRDGMHVCDDVIRFFHVHIEKKIREYFNVDRLVRARDAIQEETRAAELTAGFKAAMNVCGNEDRKQILLCYAVAGLPALHQSDVVKRWVSVSSNTMVASPRVQVDGGLVWMLPESGAKFTVMMEGSPFCTTYDGTPLTFFQSLCTALAAHYVFDVHFDGRVRWSLSFLAHHVCGLPLVSQKGSKDSGSYAYILHKLE